ncbi:MAG: TlpA family protein disulfide reductase [Candidatus Heimdallarchaeota archaeon]
MKVKKIGLTFLLLVIVTPIILSYMKIDGIENNPPTNEMAPNLIHLGAPAIDWEMKEIISDTNMTFSVDFAGKVVMIDFFATWCQPCIDSMPYLKEVNDNFAGNSKFEFMSISLDAEAYAESGLENFASNNNMDWLIFHDKYRQVDNYYDIEFIPTLLIFNKDHFVFYSEVGFSSVQNLIDIIDELLDMDDTTKPDVNSLIGDKTAISVLDSDLSISANVGDVYLRQVECILTMGNYTETQNYFTPDNGTLVYDFLLDPQIIYNESDTGVTELTIDLYAKDFSDNVNHMQLLVDVEYFADASAPSVEITDIVEIDAAGGQNFDIFVTVTDDLLIISRTIEIWIDGELDESKDMKRESGDEYYAKFYGVSVEPKGNVTVKAIAEDVAGKITIDEQSYIITSGAAGIALPVILGVFLLGNLVLIPLLRKKQK